MYVNQGPIKENGQEIWGFGQFIQCSIVRSRIKCKGEPGNFQASKNYLCIVEYLWNLQCQDFSICVVALDTRKEFIVQYYITEFEAMNHEDLLEFQQCEDIKM